MTELPQTETCDHQKLERKRIWKWAFLCAAGIHLFIFPSFFARGLKAEIDRPSNGLSQLESSGPTTNIHFTGRYCIHCHETIPKNDRRAVLKYGGDPNLLCRCHFNTQRSYWHPVNLNPAQSQIVKVPSDLPLLNGRISCITCHDIYQQCRKRRVRTNTLRGGPFKNRSDFCFKCHDKKAYASLDPHRQIDEKGNIITDMCRICHLEPPAKYQDRAKALRFIGKLDLLCQRCHMISGNHSGNVKHYGKTPKAKTLLRMKTMEAKYQVILPLDEKGMVTCVTCHNPHSNGVIDSSRPAAKGADVKFRHRLPGNMCIICHNK